MVSNPLPSSNNTQQTQMNQQMSGLAVSDGAVPTFPPSGPPVSGWAPPTPASSGQTLSTQLWK
ncbi:unnamed protein product [Tetraodon nigroviridis]|uniref:(spotted green pufferfish) hypothetical protein n=1 Tax=Tetraodon nigroviridis TaxID=99883 RepID=Q4SG62_TETNG|nr:unnamed protein product [Tetraodon nigroviridis]